MRNRRLWVAVVVLATTTAACSGGGLYGRGNHQANGPDINVTNDTPTPTPGASGGTPTLLPTASPTAIKSRGPAPTPVTSVPGIPKGYKPPTGYTIPNLFTPAENTIGITRSKITLCIHAALSLSAVFGVDQGDLNVWWDYVNHELGGVYGRQVNVVYADDNYGNTAGDVQKAYKKCKASNPFIMLGGIGFDQIPQMRVYAEQDHQLYIHHIASEDFTKKYSFSFLPSVETAGRIAGQWAVTHHRGQNIGIIYRNSENWEPGHKTFKQALAAHGVKPVADLSVIKDQSVYSSQIRALQAAHAKVVFLWENALAAIEIIREAKQQNYTPTWLVFPFNLETDKLGQAMVSPNPAEGIAMWPAYRPGDTSGTYSSYANEIRFFERVHTEYGTGKTDDITWMTWLGWRQIWKLLLDCGPDCTRNKIVGLMLGNVEKPIIGDCGFDFKRNGHVGGFFANIFQAYMKRGSASWENVASCKSGF